MEKSYEERLASLKKGCFILGILQAIGVLMSLNNLGKEGGNVGSFILSVILLAMLYFIYKYTAERNPLGPTLELIFGIILVIDGVLFCLTIIGALIGIIYIILGVGVIKESRYFAEAIANGEGSAPVVGVKVDPVDASAVDNVTAPTDTEVNNVIIEENNNDDDPIQNK